MTTAVHQKILNTSSQSSTNDSDYSDVEDDKATDIKHDVELRHSIFPSLLSTWMLDILNDGYDERNISVGKRY